MDEFYVGYLQTPRRYIRFLKVVVPVCLACSLAVGAMLIRRHADPGDGVWHDDSLQTFEGVIDTRPYPMLRVASDLPGMPAKTYLLVAEGKFGARGRVEPLEGRYVRVSGTTLERDRHQLLELADAAQSIQPVSAAPAGAAALRRPASEPIGRRTLRGEIIDPKCFCGAMKPGEGKAHKECATLCISGGIPPMFITRDAAGHTEYYLLADAAGDAVSSEIHPFIADPVEVSGVVEVLGDLKVLRLAPQNIRRL